jgi:membrane fusion protein (multidrug efflux system)
MEKMMKLTAVILISAFIAACGAATREEKKDLNSQKAELQKLKDQQIKLSDQIRKLEEEIAKSDSSVVTNAKLVQVTPLTLRNFDHFIDLQGRITTENIYYVSPRGEGGQVKAIYVKQGDEVRQGQLVMKLDDAVIQENLNQLETQLSFAKDLYSRQKNLWDQGIGTEVQYLTAKNNVENLEKQIAVTKEQWSTSNVYSNVSGVVETVDIRVGEMFTGNPAASITIVNKGNLKASVDIPENYLSRVAKGSPVVVEIPDINKRFNSTITFISQLIDSKSRGFTAEAKVPADPALKPNLLATVKIKDYSASNVIVIPLTTLQTDEKGKYVYVLVVENGKKVARKKAVVVGEVYGEQIEIKEGLVVGDQLISQGYQSIYDGQDVTTDAK